MPCNLTARADARVSNAALAKLMTAPVIEHALRAWVRSKNLPGDVRYHYYDHLKEGQLWVGTLGISVVQKPDGFTVHAGQRDGVNNAALVAEVTAFLKTVTGALLQQQLLATLKHKFAVADVQRAQNGALVVTMDI